MTLPRRALYWVFPAHDDGRPLGEASGPYESPAEVVDHLLPGGIGVQSVAFSGTWLGELAEWPVEDEDAEEVDETEGQIDEYPEGDGPGFIPEDEAW